MHHLNDESVIAYVDHLFDEAVKKHISDIHLEPFGNQYRIRLRKDGLLYVYTIVEMPLATRLIARIKVMANLNIAERRLPQDGRLQYKNIDIRVNTCPTVTAEKIVLRFLNLQNINLALSSLGLSAAQETLLLKKLSLPQGLILVTGPTGSGKTITLYSALHYLNRIEKNISTAEDPVEIQLPGINQININSKIGFDFASALRTLLRQDPNVIMIGEIRDKETAMIAIQAAETGHLVLSTLHTNNALETLLRLRSMGIDQEHLVNALTLIVAQRLIRTICKHCNQVESIHCLNCIDGYHNRTGIFELLSFEESTIQNLFANKSVNEMKLILKDQQWTSLWDAGIDKVNQGLTTLSELSRVVSQC